MIKHEIYYRNAKVFFISIAIGALLSVIGIVLFVPYLVGSILAGIGFTLWDLKKYRNEIKDEENERNS